MNKRLGFVFPGQGSQSVGMLAALAAAFPQVKQTFAEASARLDYDLWQRVQAGPDTELNRTEVTQPAMLAAGVAVWRVWRDNGGALPAVMAGHSLGEYSALVCAEALSLADAVTLVVERARCMQAAVPEGAGAMAAILGLDDAAVEALCKAHAGDDVLEAVNFNSPGQVVVAGHAQAVQRLSEHAKAAGAKRAVLLPVSVPSHCALMQPAAQAFSAALAKTDFTAPMIDVLHNVDVATRHSAAELREALAQQLFRPVRWVQTVEAMAARGVTTIIECGPGKVLTGLNKRIDKTVETLPVFDPDSLTTAFGGVGSNV